MYKIITTSVLGLIASCPVFAKAINPLCVNVSGAAFQTGDGTNANPYLICNTLQFMRLSSEPTLLTQSFQLGADLDFANTNYQIIGSVAQPFTGHFNGNEYTLSSINIPQNQNYLGMFAFLSNAVIENLNIDRLTIKNNNYHYSGGLAGYSDNSTINNIKISNLTMTGPDYSGGLIGWAVNGNISEIVVQGTIYQLFGTDAGGGLIGWASNVNLSTCASHVNIIQTNKTSFGVSYVGGLVGVDSACVINDCYADGNIDYSAAIEDYGIHAHSFGGIMGGGGSGSLNHLYFSGSVTVPLADEVGAACGAFVNNVIPTNTIFWDSDRSIVNTSQCGSGQTTATMKDANFWISNGFSPFIWNITNGAYPKLLIEG